MVPLPPDPKTIGTTELSNRHKRLLSMTARSVDDRSSATRTARDGSRRSRQLKRIGRLADGVIDSLEILARDAVRWQHIDCVAQGAQKDVCISK